jgi:hypothetical protein
MKSSKIAYHTTTALRGTIFHHILQLSLDLAQPGQQFFVYLVGGLYLKPVTSIKLFDRRVRGKLGCEQFTKGHEGDVILLGRAVEGWLG